MYFPALCTRTIITVPTKACDRIITHNSANYRESQSSCQWAQQHSPPHRVTVSVLSDKIKGTPCIMDDVHCIWMQYFLPEERPTKWPRSNYVSVMFFGACSYILNGVARAHMLWNLASYVATTAAHSPVYRMLHQKQAVLIHPLLFLKQNKNTWH